MNEYTFGTDICKTEIKSMKLSRASGFYYLRAVYRIYHKDGSIDEVTLPKIEFAAISSYRRSISVGDNATFGSREVVDLQLNTKMPLCTTITKDVPLPHYMRINRIKDGDPVRMTVAEIEDKLGYKIIIVEDLKVDEEKE